MRGTVIQRGKKWSFVVDVGRDESGKRLRKWQSGFDTKKAADAACRAFITKYETGGDPFPEEITVSAYLEKWLEHQATRIRPTTLARYRTLLGSAEVQVIGGMKLDRIKPAHIQGVLDRLLGRGLAPRTVIQARAALNSAFHQALAWGLIPTNPVQAVRPPKAERPRLNVPTTDEVGALMRTVAGTSWEIPIILACTTGARRSEVLALSWSEVDLLRGRIRITRSLQKVAGGKPAFLDPKTSRARREIVLPPVVAARLRTYRQQQLERQLALGPEWQDFNLVCDRGDGAPLYPDSFSVAFKRFAERAGLPKGSRLHDLRHAFATALLSQNIHPAIASNTLGHASPAFTMSTYQHALDGMSEQAASAITDALGL